MPSRSEPALARLARLAPVGLLTFACAAGPQRAETPEEAPVAKASSEFCSQALARLGLDGLELEECTSLLPDQHYVTAVDPDGGEGFHSVVVVERGVPVTERGYAAGAAWLKRARIPEHATLGTAVALVESLAWLDALPPDFAPAHFTDHEDRTGASRFSAEPFRLELRRPLDEPVDPLTEGLTAPGIEGRGGGPELLTQERAILTGEERFTWTLERREDSGPWAKTATIPLE